MELPVHKSETTGNAVLDRIQNNVRAVVAALRSLIVLATNSVYVALAVDVTVAASAVYATLIETTIITTSPKGWVDVTVSTSGQELSAVGTKWFLILMDGVVVNGAHVTSPAAGYAWAHAMKFRIATVSGKHTVTLQWRTDAGSARINAKSIPEEHATMLVSEVVA